MKKFLFFVMTLAVLMTACKKVENPNVSLEGNQWISEEFEAEWVYPAGMYLFDIGAKSDAGKMTIVLVATESNSTFKEGDLIKIYSGDYTYDASTGVLSSDGDAVRVEYLTSKKIQFSFVDTGSQFMVLSLVEGKQYPVKEAVEFVEFEITPSKEDDWAGGSITFTSDKTIKSLTYEVMTEGLTEKEDLCKTSLSGNTLILGEYVTADAAPANCLIKVKATDEEGNEAECIVTSKAWMPAVYTESDGKYTQFDLKNVLAGGTEYYIGALCADGEIPYVRETDSFSGISYKLPSFMKPFGSKDDKVACDAKSVNDFGYITYTYGALSYVISVVVGL